MQKMRHYLTGQTIHVISKFSPLRLLMTKPFALNGRLTKWAMLLFQYYMQFLPHKAIKGQDIAEFLVDNPGSDKTRLHEDLPDETAEAHSTHTVLQMWELY